jgi:carbon storage regulator
MLVLSRKENQQLIIGENIIVRVVRVEGGRVRLGIEAPAEVPIRREELASRSAVDRTPPNMLVGAG